MVFFDGLFSLFDFFGCLFVFSFIICGEKRRVRFLPLFTLVQCWFSVGSVVEGVGWSDHASRLMFAAFSRRKLDAVFVVLAGGIVLFV